MMIFLSREGKEPIADLAQIDRAARRFGRGGEMTPAKADGGSELVNDRTSALFFRLATIVVQEIQ